MQTEKNTNNRPRLLPRHQKPSELADNFTTNTIQISGSQNKFSQLILIRFPGILMQMNNNMHYSKVEIFILAD